MKNSKFFLFFLGFILLASCETDDSTSITDNTFIGDWVLVKRNWSFSNGPLFNAEIDKAVSLEILSDSTVIYKDSLLNYYREGHIVNEYGNYRVYFDNSNYYYNIGENWTEDDTLKSVHFFPIPHGEPATYFDSFIRIDD